MAADRKRLNLALQGGGSHGAFTWGVLDRLLADERVEIEGISGTGSGALNGAVMAHGYAQDGASGAREALERFWRRWSEFSVPNPFQNGLLDRLTGNWNLDENPFAVWREMLEHSLSPYQLNPLNLSPLRVVLGETIAIDRVRDGPLKLFVAATNVRTGKVRIFERRQLTTDMLLAATCLPQVEQAVIIDDEPYWDGGIMGNPPIFPLIYEASAPDILIVQLDPISHEGIPKTSAQITDRLNEITFNANLMREMRAIAFVTSLIDDPDIETEQLKRIHLHMIGDEARMRPLGFTSKFNTDLAFLLYLKELGEVAAEKWLGASLADIGHRSSLDLRAIFL